VDVKPHDAFMFFVVLRVFCYVVCFDHNCGNSSHYDMSPDASDGICSLANLQ
jgi:hypothetical protein